MFLAEKALANFIGLPYFSGFLSGFKSNALYVLYHITNSLNSANKNSSYNHMASIKIPTVILLCYFGKHTVLYILHTKWELVVKGHSVPFCIFFVTPKPNFRYFRQHLWLFTYWGQLW